MKPKYRIVQPRGTDSYFLQRRRLGVWWQMGHVFLYPSEAYAYLERRLRPLRVIQVLDVKGEVVR